MLGGTCNFKQSSVFNKLNLRANKFTPQYFQITYKNFVVTWN